MLLGAVNGDRVGLRPCLCPTGPVFREPVRGRGAILHAAASLIGPAGPVARRPRSARDPWRSSPARRRSTASSSGSATFPPRPEPEGWVGPAAPLPDDGVPRRRSLGARAADRGTDRRLRPRRRAAGDARGQPARPRRPRRVARAAATRPGRRSSPTRSAGWSSARRTTASTRWCGSSTRGCAPAAAAAASSAIAMSPLAVPSLPIAPRNLRLADPLWLLALARHPAGGLAARPRPRAGAARALRRRLAPRVARRRVALDRPAAPSPGSSCSIGALARPQTDRGQARGPLPGLRHHARRSTSPARC